MIQESFTYKNSHYFYYDYWYDRVKVHTFRFWVKKSVNVEENTYTCSSWHVIIYEDKSITDNDNLRFQLRLNVDFNRVDFFNI